jgi:uncharacterized protein (UPF0332 family)
MCYLEQKSEENIRAAEHLIAQGCYTSSIHCSYYACIQRMLNFFYAIKNYDKAGVDADAQAITSITRKGLHEAYIEMIGKEFSNKNRARDKADFMNRISALKKERTKSDYFNLALYPKPKSEEVLKKSREVVLLIKKLEL